MQEDLESVPEIVQPPQLNDYLWSYILDIKYENYLDDIWFDSYKGNKSEFDSVVRKLSTTMNIKDYVRSFVKYNDYLDKVQFGLVARTYPTHKSDTAFEIYLEGLSYASTTFGNNTLLMEACRDYPDKVPLLLDFGIDINYHNDNGQTALIIATRYNPSVLHLLLNCGSDIYYQDKLGTNALMCACMYTPIAVPLLIEAGSHLNEIDNKGKTALIHAIIKGHIDAVQMLVEAGCKLDEYDEYGWTALMYACDYLPEAIKILLDGKCDVDAVGYDGYTALLNVCDS
eukprot:TRINITY_DN2150_c0_g1_i1.p1 TRINITY_DN2150_c0_g1~~TRINITY_DN2150_c0_g1_i1.p1  ORF type:complete len:285 (-),score=51.16 TRINITY_DN2150_c0_g1_i1:47-901(-)